MNHNIFHQFKTDVNNLFERKPQVQTKDDYIQRLESIVRDFIQKTDGEGNVTTQSRENKATNTFYLNAINAIQDIIIIIDAELKIVFANTVFRNNCAKYKLQPPDVGSKIQDILPYLTESDLLESQKVLQNGITIHKEKKIEILGKTFYVVIKKSPFYTHSQTGYILISVQDVTLQKLHEQKVIESEEKYRRLFNASNDAVVLANTNIKIIDVNKACCRLLELSKEDILSTDPLKFLDKKNRNIVQRQIQKMRTDGTSFFELEFKKANGERVVANIKTGFIDSKKQLVQAIIRDISERKKYEAELNKSRNNLQAILDNSPQAIIMFSSDFKIISFNKVSAKFSKENINRQLETGKSILEYILPDVKNNFIRATEKCLQEGILRYERKLEFPKEKIRYYEFTFVPVIHKGKKNPEIVLNILDITERVESREKLKKQQQFSDTIIDNLPIGLQIFDTSGTLLRENEAQKPISQKIYETYEINLFNIFTSEYPARQFLINNYKTALKGEIKSVKTDIYYTPSPTPLSTLSLQLSLIPIFETTDKITALLVLTTNITNEKQMEDNLKKSKQKFEDLVNLVPQTVFEMDQKLNMLFVNPPGLEMFNYTSKDLEDGINLKDLIHDSSKKDMRNNMHRIITKKQQTSRGEYRFKRKDGTLFKGMVYSRFIFKDNTLNQIKGIVIDISDREKHEKQLEKSEAKFRSIVEQSQQGITIINSKGIIELWNPMMEKITGFNKTNTIGKTIWDLHQQWHPKNQLREQSEKRIKQLFKDKEETLLFNRKSKIKTAQNEYKNVQITVFKIDASSDYLLCAMCIDTTEMVRNEETLKKKNEELRNANIKMKKKEEILAKQVDKANEMQRTKSEFLANLSHDIRTPIHVIRGQTALIKEKTGNAKELNECFTAIEHNCENMINLFEDVLLLTKINTVNEKIIKNTFNIREFMDEIHTTFYYKAREKGISFRIKIDKNIPDTIKSSKTHLRQILLNIIGNALKFTKKGGVSVGIAPINAPKQPKNTGLKFIVKDTGRGIPKRKFREIFKPFRQYNQLEQGLIGGVGLGLAISYKLVKKLQGKISLKSELGKGTTFRIRIFDIDLLYDKPLVTEQQEKKCIVTFKTCNVLFVDTDKKNIKFIDEFNPKGLNKIIIDSMSEVYTAIKKNIIDTIVIFVDAQWQDFLRQIERMQDKKTRFPVIAIVKPQIIKNNSQLIKNYVDSYLTTDFKYNELINTLAKYLPHKIVSKKQMQNPGDTLWSDLKKTKHLISESTKNELITSYREAKNYMSIIKIENFANVLKKTGSELQLQSIVNYGKLIAKAAKLYRINEINGYINELKILEKL